MKTTYEKIFEEIIAMH